MYHARNAVNRKFLFYREDMADTGPDHIKLEAELRKALERGQLRLHYQPQVDTGDGSIVAAEALLRWDHPEYGHVPPLKFIPLAEDIGIIGELGDWVLTEATRQLNAFQEEGLKLPRVAINVSTFQFGHAFVERIREVFEASGLAPSALELGLSEGLLMNKDAETLRALNELREMGVCLSVDDFGTGYAPIGYLGRYPLDEIKIDRSFVRDCDRRAESGRLVLATIAMAKSLGLRVVAEGVETAEEYRFLTANGVRLMQGYLFSKPVPALELQQQLNVGWHYLEQVQRLALQAQSGEDGNPSQRVSAYQ
jgi:EAL domain-containing protein (putative c-di-GMP-specific phosphodiesterase class I)